MKIDNNIVSPPPSFYTPKEVAAILRFKKVDQVYAPVSQQGHTFPFN